MVAIKLIDLLKEIINPGPKAIFLAGPAGAGKSYIRKQLRISDFRVLNIDDTYEALLRASGIGTNQKDFDQEQLSQAAKLMSTAVKVSKEKYAASIKNLNNIIIDGTAGSYNPTYKKKEELEALGYKTLMLMVWVSPITSLERNKNRDRSLLPSIVLRSWRDINKNIKAYEQLFGSDFIIIDNEPEGTKLEYDVEDIKRLFFDTAKYKSKEKTPEELVKSKAEVEQLNNDIKELIQQQPNFTSLEDAKSKINAFIK